MYKTKNIVIKPGHKLEDLELNLNNENYKKIVGKIIFAIKIQNKIYKPAIYKDVIALSIFDARKKLSKKKSKI